MGEPTLQAELKICITDFTIQVELETGPELVVVFGPSGAGKSLVLRTLAGLVRPDDGFIRLGNRVLFDKKTGINLPPQKRRVGYVPQQYALFPHRSIVGNIAYALHDLPRKERLNRIRDLLKLMDLEDQADRKPHQVSGGQQQRVALARALARRPDLLLMDEPFAALDEPLRIHLRSELRQVQTHFGIPVILVTHNLVEAYSLADQLVVVDRGQVIQAGSRDEVFRRPSTVEVARLMGMTNILQTTIINHEDDRLTLDWLGNTLVVDSTAPVRKEKLLNIGIRPEDVIVVRKNRKLEGDVAQNLLHGVIVEDKAQGFDHLLAFAIQSSERNDQHLYVRIPHPVYLKLNLTLGEKRVLSIKPSSFHIFPYHESQPVK